MYNNINFITNYKISENIYIKFFIIKIYSTHLLRKLNIYIYILT